MEKISVVLGDWQVLFREGIHFTLSGEEGIEVIDEVTSAEEALGFIEKNPPDVAILNADQGKPSGIEVTRRIKQNLPPVAVILIMDNDNEEQLFSILKCGASACVTKDIDPLDLVNIVRKVAQGTHPISEVLLRPGVAAQVIDEFEAFSLISKEVNNLLASLFSREGEILRHIADGSSIEQVSQALDTNEETIRRHLDLILTKLVANDHSREVIEATQSHLPSIVSRGRRAGRPEVEYITKDEFTEFKDSLRERFRSLSGELG